MTSVPRLIQSFVPEHYDLKLELDEQSHTFTGTVSIRGESVSGHKSIKLHAKDLIIISAAIDGLPAKHESGEYDELQIVSTELASGEHTVDVSFSGVISDQMHGLYPCYYEHEGVKKQLFATQFESHHAREVFPCVDEPAAKATYNLELTTAFDQTVLSNMPVSDKSEQDGHLVTRFETTPRMSSYLLAFVVGELHSKSAKTSTGVDVTVWSTPAQPAASLDFASDIAVRAIEFYNEYFDTPYPLPKSDLVALPDFSSGAMENWGLITFREIALLVDPKTTSISSRRYVAMVICHELAHMWFGNLVTMKWWNDLWLNESFATLMEYIAVDKLHPEWNIWLEFSTSESIAALRRDSLDGVQAVQVQVNHPDEINTIFDSAIVYAKGARLMRMIRQYIGDDAFRAGLKQYFVDHSYDNTVGDDLWDALGGASGKPVKSIMNTWISQPGFPVVTIVRDGDSLSLTQQQFFVGPHQPSDRIWPIPLDTDDQTAPKLFDSPVAQHTLEGPIRLNQTDSAHFITHYDDRSYQHLIDQVINGSLDPIGRVQLLDEATLLARGGVMPSDRLLPLIKAYRHESLEPVWDIIGLAIGELRKFVEDNPEAETKLRQLSAQLAHDQYERLGWEPKDGESEDDAKLRANVISLTLYGEVPEALEMAQNIYKDTPLGDMNPELRALIISSVSHYGDASVVDSLLELYKNTQLVDIRQDIALGMTSTRVPEKIVQLLESIKNPAIVRPQDVAHWFVYLIRGRESRDIAWKWIRDNWDWIVKTFAGDKSYDDYPRYSAAAPRTRKQLEEYKNFFEPLQHIPALSRAIVIGIREIEGRVELIERDKTSVVKALLDLDNLQD